MADFFCIFHALSFELNFFRLEFPFKTNFCGFFKQKRVQYLLYLKIVFPVSLLFQYSHLVCEQ